MPTIQNAELAITTDRPRQRATVIVKCDVNFTEVEVNAMDMLGLRYTLGCQVLNKYLLDEDPVITFGDGRSRADPADAASTWCSRRQGQGRPARAAARQDKLIAELTLRTTKRAVVQRTYDRGRPRCLTPRSISAEVQLRERRSCALDAPKRARASRVEALLALDCTAATCTTRLPRVANASISTVASRLPEGIPAEWIRQRGSNGGARKTVCTGSRHR